MTIIFYGKYLVRAILSTLIVVTIFYMIAYLNLDTFKERIHQAKNNIEKIIDNESRGRPPKATTPSLRATSPQGEAFCMAPIEGSCRHSRLWGGFLMLYAFATTPSLRDTSPQGKAFLYGFP